MKKTSSSKPPKEFLQYLNSRYHKLHSAYEKLFWISSMGDHGVDTKKDEAKAKLLAFQTNAKLLAKVREYKKISQESLRERFGYWELFFSRNETPASARILKSKITALETKIHSDRATRKEGYIDPKTKKFVKTSRNALGSLIATADDEEVRKACFDALQKLAITNTSSYVRLVKLRNEYAHRVGYKNFYEYKLMLEEGMTMSELFDLFDPIYEKTKYAFRDIRALEKRKPGLRKPWNFGYMMAGSFVKEEDQYFPFEEAVTRWGQSFAALGITYKKGSLVLDLLDREGKYNNGFCHWPELVRFEDSKRIPGSSDFTCNVVLGIPGEANQGYNTLFHEGGHAAHLLNSEMPDVCINSEYPPLSTAWAETQSMFLDSIFSSHEWESRYAKNSKGEYYPFELFEEQLHKLHVVSPLYMMSIAMVCRFERDVYSAKKLTPALVEKLAKKHFKMHTDRSVDSLWLLEVPHLYSSDSACSYHGYGLAVLALTQWREYFYKKYGYIVDNPHVGKEMAAVWKYGGSKTFPEFVKLATKKKLSADAHIRSVTVPLNKKIALVKKRVLVLAKKPKYKKKIDLDAKITMIHGKQKIADTSRGFEAMAQKYATWLKKQYKK